MNIQVMIIFLITFFLGVEGPITPSDDSKCTSLNPLAKYSELCKRWWLKTFYHKATDTARRDCIQLIVKKCPAMLDIKMISLHKNYNKDELSDETWKYEMKATPIYNGLDTNNDWRIYYDIKERPLCFHEEKVSVTCEHWWEVARLDRAKDSDKQFCINQIIKYCNDFISMRDEGNIEDSQCCGRVSERKRVTYVDKDGMTASFITST